MKTRCPSQRFAEVPRSLRPEVNEKMARLQVQAVQSRQPAEMSQQQSRGNSLSQAAFVRLGPDAERGVAELFAAGGVADSGAC